VTTTYAVDDKGLPQDQLDLIQQFEADYNSIDQFLRKSLDSDRRASFSYLVSEYSRRHSGWRDADLLRMTAEVRNAIVHGKTEPYRYVAVPTPAVVLKLRACKERLINPSRVFQTFQRKVETILLQDSLSHVLKNIEQRDYSQFPVYDAGRFRGLLTENGITRWLAHHVTHRLSLVELDDVPVKQVLHNEEKRKTYHFVGRDTHLDDVRDLFSSHESLEAVFITANGKESEGLLGIATRWDTLHLK
jgi:predicted transcriptional regulator